MNVPSVEDIDSEFRVLVEDYDEEGFVGGVFEGSHVYGDLIIFRLYSILTEEDTKTLRIETRHHCAGRIVDHSRNDLELAEDGTVGESRKSLDEFCRDHHFKAPRQEFESLVDEVDGSDQFDRW